MQPRIGSPYTADGVKGVVLVVHGNGRVQLRLPDGTKRLVVYDRNLWDASQADRAENFAKTMAAKNGKGRQYCVLSMLTGEVLYRGSSELRCAVASEPGTCYSFAWSTPGALENARALRERCMKNKPSVPKRQTA